jgi:hypothetical protein
VASEAEASEAAVPAEVGKGFGGGGSSGFGKNLNKKNPAIAGFFI